MTGLQAGILCFLAYLLGIVAGAYIASNHYKGRR